MLVPHDADQDARGAKPTFWARWAGFDDEVSPWSLPMSMAIARAEAAKEKASEADAGKGKAEDVKDQMLKMAA